VVASLMVPVPRAMFEAGLQQRGALAGVQGAMSWVPWKAAPTYEEGTAG
jgi:hypothetical protein